MKYIIKITMAVLCLILISSCNSKTIRIGENRFSIDLKYNGKPLNAQGRIYINNKFIGMTNEDGDLSINLRKGEYGILIILEGYATWQEKLLIVGNGYSQSISPNMKKLSAGKM
ncbi:hypothetical protein IIC38_17760 [candidate division KSB1 bacterium]|nr:hypothetical protein [candidate division KSB1 bacterium]